MNPPNEVQPTNRVDAALIGVGLALMAAYTVAHSRGMFWSDELMGWLVMREPTFSGMIREWWAGADSGSLFYMVVGRLWLAHIGASEFSLRVFSAIFVGVGFAVFWIAARRFYSRAVVAFCVPAVFLFNQILSWQLSNGRMYGGFIAASAFVILAFFKADPELPETRALYPITFFAHLALLCSHILGPLYSGAFIVGLFVQDRLAHRFRPRLYLSALASWPILAVTIESTFGTAALGKGGYWTTRPSVLDFFRGIFDFDRQILHMALAMFLLVITMGVMVLIAGGRAKTKAAFETGQPRRPVFVVLLVFLAILLLTWVVSRFTASIFYDRYLLPVTLGNALLLCELGQRSVNLAGTQKQVKLGLALIAFLFFAYKYTILYRHPYYLPQRDYTAELIARDPSALPILITDYAMFAETVFYHPHSPKVLMFIDWSIAGDKDFGPGGLAGPHEMDNWKAAGYFDGHLLPTASFLSTTPEFYLINEPHHTLWFRRYIQNNPAYEALRQPSFHGDDVWLVHRKLT